MAAHSEHDIIQPHHPLEDPDKTILQMDEAVLEMPKRNFSFERTVLLNNLSISFGDIKKP